MSTKKLTLLNADPANGNDKFRNELGFWKTNSSGDPVYARYPNRIEAIKFTDGESFVGSPDEDSFYKTKLTGDLSELNSVATGVSGVFSADFSVDTPSSGNTSGALYVPDKGNIQKFANT